MSVAAASCPPEVAFMENATFTLYGNDTAIFRPSGSSDSLYDPLPPYACSILSPAQVDDLLTLILDQGGLTDANELYPNPYVVDAPDTTFSVDADGVQKTVVVQALGYDDAGVEDPEARAGVTASRLSARIGRVWMNGASRKKRAVNRRLRARTGVPSMMARSTRSGWRRSGAWMTMPPEGMPTTLARRAGTRCSMSPATRSVVWLNDAEGSWLLRPNPDRSDARQWKPGSLSMC